MIALPETVIKIALSEEGYLEKSKNAYIADPSILYKKIDGAGSDNYTKYGKEMHDVYPKVMDFPAYWCDAFVDWCFYKAYGVTTAKSLLEGNFDDYTVASATMYNNHKALDRIPKIGDQIFFTKNGEISGCHHTGIVYDIDEKYIYTIEGNTSVNSGVVSNGGGVARKKYSRLEYKSRMLFGHPAYTMSIPSSHTPLSYVEGKIYKVVCSALNARLKPFDQGVSAIPNGKVVEVKRHGDKVHCLQVAHIGNKIWIKIGDSSENGEIWVCADSGITSYIGEV